MPMRWLTWRSMPEERLGSKIEKRRCNRNPRWMRTSPVPARRPSFRERCAPATSMVRLFPTNDWICRKELKLSSNSSGRQKASAEPLGRDGLQRVGTVERVALRRDVAGVRDDATQFLFIGAVAYARRVHHILFDQD